MKAKRRDFLHRAAALTAGGFASRLAPLSLLGLAARANAQASTDYKALVCVFLYGGVDGNNLLLPLDTPGYASYTAVRPAASGVGLASSDILPIQPANVSSPYGLHAKLRDIHPLFAQGKLALLANVGTLNEPTTKQNFLAKRPDSLFSHSDQQNQWQSSVSSAQSQTGWGGRIADRVAAQNGAFPVVTSIAGSSLFIAGDTTAPLAVPTSGGFGLVGIDANGPTGALLTAIQSLHAVDRGNAYVKAAGDVFTQAVSLSGVVDPILSSGSSSIQSLFAGQSSSIAQQFLQVAKLIEARGRTGARRQIFFVALNGFDTHSNQLVVMNNLLGQLSPALRSFYDATVQLGVANQVTTFTLSDFGRTFRPASGAGTDHAWGNHHLILGGAVRGGQMYGRYPTLALAGPDDADTAGRWIPSTSVEQYGATLARWFGLDDAALAAVFPNLARFAPASLGFLG